MNGGRQPRPQRLQRVAQPRQQPVAWGVAAAVAACCACGWRRVWNVVAVLKPTSRIRWLTVTMVGYAFDAATVRNSFNDDRERLGIPALENMA
jgi:hypothetical protein